MSQIILKCLVLFATAVTFMGCGTEHGDGTLPTNSLLTNMTPAERQKKAPNKAFEAVFEKDRSAVDFVLEEDRQQFLTKNSDGLTPLMIAIRLRQKEMSAAIVANMSIEDLMDKDSNGRGYLSYAAEQGFVQLIDQIAAKYKASIRWGYEGFYNIDFTDNFDRRALFYASTSAVAQRLKNYWMQWSVAKVMQNTWWSQFYQAQDIEEQNFIHTASAANRFDLVNWAKVELCGPKLLEGNTYILGLLEGVGEIFDYTTGLLQIVPGVPDNMFNQKNMYGNTPLHLATQFGNREAANSLMSCRFTRYNVKNQLGRNPLANVIAHADSNKAEVEQSRKDIFNSLLKRENHIRNWWSNIVDIVDDRDEEGKSALHYAAQLKDPYFYNVLKDIGNVYLRDNDQRTPIDIFKARH